MSPSATDQQERSATPDSEFSIEVDIPNEEPCRGTANVFYHKDLAAPATMVQMDTAAPPPIHKPLLIVEGFTHPRSGLAPLYQQANAQGTVDRMRGLGYDVVLLDLENPQRRIQDNAQLVIRCIQRLLGSTRAPLVVAGISMGGLAARLALAQMEALGHPHFTRIYLSIDTPHRGAYTSLAVQWFAQKFARESPQLAAMVELLDSEANQQFLVQYLDGGTPVVSRLREEFLADLRMAGGYPRQPRLLAVACGRGDGKREVHAPQLAVTMRNGSLGNVELWCLPDAVDGAGIVASAHSQGEAPLELRVPSSHVWDDVPGGQNEYFALAAGIAQNGPGGSFGEVKLHHSRSCAVPTVSALDLDQDLFAPIPPPSSGRSPFHDYITCDRNETHATITPEASRWIVQNLFDPHAPDFLRDPYPTYRVFRDTDPVFKVKPYDAYWVFRYEDVRRVLLDRDCFQKNPDSISPPPFDVLRHLPESPLASDPPRHTLLRGFVDPLFAQEIERAELWTERIATDLLARIKDLGRFDLISDFALPLPSRIIQKLLGVPAEGWPMVENWVAAIAHGHDITQPVDVQLRGGTCNFALSGYYQAFLLGCQAKPENPGLIETMSLHAERQGMRQEDVQVVASVISIAGYLSTTFLLGTGLLRLLEHPDQLESLRRAITSQRGDEVLATAVQEMLRYDTPAQLIDRIAAEDVVLSGVKIRAGEKVTAVLGSANRDERAIRNPDTFDIDRSVNPDLPAVAFGDGIHRCLGEPLVKKVMPTALRALIETYRTLRLAGTPQWQTDPYLRGLTSLPLATYDQASV